MKLVRFGQKGKAKPGLWRDGKIVDLRKIFPEIPDISDAFFREGWLEKVAQVKNTGQKCKKKYIFGYCHCFFIYRSNYDLFSQVLNLFTL